MSPRRPFCLVLIVALLMTGCAAPSGPQAGSSATSDGAGRIVFADGDRLLLADPATKGAPKEIYHSRGKGTITDPAWSPDRSTIAYSYTPVPAPATSFGSDIVVINADGSNVRTLFKHDRDGGLARAPAWSADGKSIYFAYSFSHKLPGQQYFTTVQQIEQLEVATGGRGVVATEADSPAVSADGSKLAFIRLPSDVILGQPVKPGATAPTPSLSVANADGSNARTLVKDGAFFMIWSARFSPDGRSLVFTAAGGERSQPRLKISLPRSSGTAWVPSVAAHGFPLDLWLVDVETGKLELLAALAADDLIATWSPDGKRLALQAADGLFVLDLVSGGVTSISTSIGFGAFDWAR